MKKADIVALEMIHRVEIASRFLKSKLASTKSILDSKSEIFNEEQLRIALDCCMYIMNEIICLRFLYKT